MNDFISQSIHNFRMLIGCATLVALASCGGSSSPEGEMPVTALQVESFKTNIVDDAAKNMGVSIFQVLDVGETVPRGFKHTGELTLAFNAANADDIVFEAVSGVVEGLEKTKNGRWIYSVNATDLPEGYHPYAIKAKNLKTGDVAIFEGTIRVATPVAVVDVSLSNEGKKVDVGREVIQFGVSNLPKNANVKIVATQSSGGIRYIVQSDLSLSDYDVKISFPEDAGKFDPYNVLDENPSAIKSAANALQLGLAKMMSASIDGEKINAEPYKKNTVGAIVDAQGVEPIIRRGLGSVVLQGNLNTYSESRMLQAIMVPVGAVAGAVVDAGQSVGVLVGVGDEANLGNGAVAGEKAYQATSNAIFQRHWENTDNTFGSDGSLWGEVKDAAGAIKNQIKFDRRPSWELHSSIIVDPRLIDWSKYEPVLFVHGFAPTIGGGEDTWNKFPKLALQTQLPNGKTLIPFEFHWYTTQSFRLAAKDLGEAVNYISRVSGGQKVHIVAHSFGGVLTRTMLQGLSKDPALTNGARFKVASVTSVGTPYSGILQKPKVLDGVQLPMGNFDIGSLSHIINTCVSVTCYEMGGAPLIDAAYTDKGMERVGLFGKYANPGQLLSDMNKTETELPELPIYQGIGLVKKPGEAIYQDGDWLISFAGQRFRAGRTPDLRDKTIRPLFDGEQVGQAKVTEIILGELPTVRPLESVAENKLPSLRPRGYLHSSVTGNGNWFGTDGGDKQTGLMAAPDAECDIPATCEHAGYLLLRQALNDKFTFSNREYDRNNQLPAGAISIRKSVALSDAQKIKAQAIIDLIRAKALISGANINWNTLDPADRQLVWRMMDELPNNDTVTSLLRINATAATGMGDYYEAKLKSFNMAAAGEGLWGEGALKDWMKVAEAELKGVKGVLTVAYPGSAMAASTGAVAIRNTSVVTKIAKRIKLLTQSAQWASVANNCGFQNPIEFEAALEKLLVGEPATKSDLETVVLKPLNCLASGLQFGSDDASKWGTLIALLTARYELEDGQTAEGMQVALSILDAAAGLVPESVAITQTKGVLDVASAFVDAYVAGKAMNDRADTAYFGKFYEFEARAKLWDQKYLAERTQLLLTAKGNYLFEVSYETPGVSVEPTTIYVGQRVLIWGSNVWESIQTAVYDIGGRITSVAREAADTVSKAFGLEWIFESAGEQTVRVGYIDKDGVSLGSSTLVVTPSASIYVDIVQLQDDRNNPATVIAQDGTTEDATPVIFGTLSTALTSGQKLKVYDGASTEGSFAVVNGGSWTFSPTTPLNPGNHSFTAVVVGVDGAEGPQSSAFKFTVSAATTPSTDVQLQDNFNGSELDASIWNIKGTTNCGGHQVSGGSLTFYGGSYADTKGKKVFSGRKIVVQARMAGRGGNRDTKFALVDVETDDLIMFGDTNYSATAAPGVYLLGAGAYATDKRGLDSSTNQFRDYRMTVQGTRVLLEWGDANAGNMKTRSFDLPKTTAGRSFYLLISTGASDCFYSPGTFESISVKTDALLVDHIEDDFDAEVLNLDQWSSVGYGYEVAPANTSLTGSYTLGSGVIDLGYAGGIATLGKKHFKGHKIVVEARVARTGSGEFPIMLVRQDNFADRLVVSDTPYCNAGFLGGVSGRFEFLQKQPNCEGSLQSGFLLGQPAAVGQWMEYRMTIEGDKFTMERGPTLANITQSATATLNEAIDPYEFFLYFRTGSSGGYYGAKFDWIRVKTSDASGMGNNVFSGGMVSDSCKSCAENIYGTANAIIDGDVTFGRNLREYSGEFEILLPNARALSKIEMLPSMTPNGLVDYEVKISTDISGDSWTTVWSGSELWADKVLVSKALPVTVQNVLRAKIIVRSSPSWVALLEVYGH
jgi:pimeloyl-ACP methyl ester carboxylesterase